jgi:hypothetical protein
MRSDLERAARQYTSRIIRPETSFQVLSMYTPQLPHAMRKPASIGGILPTIAVPHIVITQTQVLIPLAIFPTFVSARHTGISRRYDTEELLRQLAQNGYGKENEYRKQIEPRPLSYRPGHITANQEGVESDTG